MILLYFIIWNFLFPLIKVSSSWISVYKLSRIPIYTFKIKSANHAYIESNVFFKILLFLTLELKIKETVISTQSGFIFNKNDYQLLQNKFQRFTLQITGRLSAGGKCDLLNRLHVLPCPSTSFHVLPRPSHSKQREPN